MNDNARFLDNKQWYHTEHFSQQKKGATPQLIVFTTRYKYVYHVIEINQIIRIKNPNQMLYDTYGEEYLTFLQELNEILSVNELAELDYM